ncbi:MAG: hypothetical protein AAFU73_16020 [Planctomycetota bacterium]
MTGKDRAEPPLLRPAAPRRAPRHAAPASGARAGGRGGSARLFALACAAAAVSLGFLAANLHGLELFGRPDADEVSADAGPAASETLARAPRRVTAQPVRPGAGSTSAAPVDRSESATLEAARLNEEGVAAMEVLDYDRAIECFVRALELVPEESTFAHNATEAHVKRGIEWPETEAELKVQDFEAALLTVQTDERRADIEALLDRARALAEAERDFVVEATLHFTFRFDGARPELYAGIDALKNVLEETYQEYGELFRRRPVEEGEPRIEVVLYGRRGFDRVTGLGDWAGGAFDGSIRVPVDELESRASVARITRVLRHETAHAFVRSVGGRDVPAWLNEGVAERLEEPGRRAFDVRFARGRLASDPAALFPLSELRGTLASWSDRAKIRRAYDQALAFTDFLAAQYGEDLVYDLVAACKGVGDEGARAHFRDVLLFELDVALGDFRDELAR